MDDSVVLSKAPPPAVIDLYSTLYFNGIWTDKFQTDETNTEAFHKADGTTVMVPMMHQFYGGLELHLSGKNFQALRLPYRPSNDCNTVFDAMYIILSEQGNSTAQIVGRIGEHRTGCIFIRLEDQGRRPQYTSF
jgi:serine protease inhibitor